MLAFGKLRASNPQPLRHVSELRLYHAKECKMDAMKARIGDHTDTIFRRQHDTMATRACQPARFSG